MTRCCPRCCSHKGSSTKAASSSMNPSGASLRASLTASAGAMSQAWALARLPSTRWLRGNLAGAEAAALDAEAAASRRVDWAELSLLAAWRPAVALAASRFGLAVEQAERALALYRRSDYAFTPLVAQPRVRSPGRSSATSPEHTAA